MLQSKNPTTTKAWQQLENHYEALSNTTMKELFANDSERFNKFSVKFEEILLDYSKNILDEKALSLLIQLAEECGLKDAIGQMFAGEKINKTEDRAVYT
jgi:glucose-6-phosphate isomerase